MDEKDALDALTALAHPTRLAVFRLLVTAGPDGLAAGAIADRLGVLPNTLSSHLGLLSRGGLVVASRKGRSIRYAADYEGMTGLLAFLVADCCGGRTDICAPLAEIVASAGDCAPALERKGQETPA